MAETVAKWKQKDPADIADYWFFWDDFLTADPLIADAVGPDEIIVDHDITMPVGLTLLAASHTDKLVRIRLSGGTADADYPITCHITTDTGQEFDSTKTLKVRERTDVRA